MIAEKLKINLTQRILNVNDTKILKKIDALLNNENIIGYSMDGNPISEKEYITDIQEAIIQLRNGKLETFSSNEVRKQILK